MSWKELVKPQEQFCDQGSIAYKLSPKELGTDHQYSFVGDLYPVARSAFKQEDSPGFLEDVKSHLFKNPYALVFVDPSGCAQAFLVWDEMVIGDNLVIYFSGICLKEEFQGRGIGSKMLEQAVKISSEKSSTITHMMLRTQNPIMQSCFTKAVGLGGGETFLFGDKDIPEDIQSLVAKVAHKLGDTRVNPKTLTSRGLYGSVMYGDEYGVVGKSDKTNFAGLDHANGDAAYCIWRK